MLSVQPFEGHRISFRSEAVLSCLVIRQENDEQTSGKCRNKKSQPSNQLNVQSVQGNDCRGEAHIFFLYFLDNLIEHRHCNDSLTLLPNNNPKLSSADR